MTSDELRQARNAERIKQIASDFGFLSCGISKAGFLEEEAPRLEEWLRNGHHGKMGYMERNFDKRLDPRLLVPGAKSVVSLLFNYASDRESRDDSFKISKYAFGADYHEVVKARLHGMLKVLRTELGDFGGRAFVDSAPVLDKAWAAKSGLGWVGKNANLISKKVGSYFFVAELIIDLDLTPDGPTTDHCGSCTRCLDACPTGAIIRPYVVDGSRCISYFTIEIKDAIPQEFKGTFDNWMFGCDVCQEVCPWNRFSTPHQHADLAPNDQLLAMTKKDWIELTEEVFENITQASPIKRAGFDGIKRTIEFLAQASTGEKDS